MPRISRGCLRCRQRRVKCDEGRPVCQRCITRGEACIGYRDESDLVFRHETEKVSGAFQAPVLTTAADKTSMGVSSPATQRQRSTSVGPDLTGHYAISIESRQPYLNPPTHESVQASKAYPWLNTAQKAGSDESGTEALVDAFFNRYVVYPCSPYSSAGFLEHLPCLFKEVNVDGRRALRWAVQASAFADASRDDDPALFNRALEYYGLALSALSQSLSETGKPPDDYDLMTVVVLDIFETLFLCNEPSPGSHAQGMAHILRLRGLDQFHDPRGWGLFRLAHHRLQKQQLAYHLGPSNETETFLDHLNEDLSFVHLEKDAFKIYSICSRGRDLGSQLEKKDMAVEELIAVVREMHVLDQKVVDWRRGPEWAFNTVRKTELKGDPGLIATFPGFIELHRDAWIAYEWNYHRTARIIMHEQLLGCLRRVSTISGQGDKDSPDLALLAPYEIESTTIIRSLADKVLATVPQTFGDINHAGDLRDPSHEPPRCRAIGAYLLLWPIKIIKSPTSSATESQRAMAQSVFERIREYTGMKTHLGDLSKI